MTYYIIPFFILIVFVFAYRKEINAYEAFIEGAKEGITMCVKIIPYVLSMIFATMLLRASGLLDDFFSLFNTRTPYELYLQGFFRPISGNAALSVMLDIFKIHGVDSKVGIAASILEGSSDTTLYIATLYFGSVGVVKYKYAIRAGLLADFIGFVFTLLIFNFLL